MGTSFTDPAGLGSVDSGDPCDFSSVAYDPISCANVTPSSGVDPGLSIDSGDPCDPASYAYDPVACAGSGTSPYDVGIDPAVISWCDANPGMCDGNGPTAFGLDTFCADNPAKCAQLSDGTLSYPGPANPVTSGPGTGLSPSKGGGFKLPGFSGAGGAASGISGLLGSLFSGVTSVFSTCPAGFFKNSNGQCVKSGTATVPAGSGLLGGVNVGTLLLVGVVLVVLVKMRKG